MRRLAVGVARGLAHLHKHNVVHGDLAARNVLLALDAEGDNQGVVVPKVSDFGMATSGVGDGGETARRRVRRTEPRQHSMGICDWELF